MGTSALVRAFLVLFFVWKCNGMAIEREEERRNSSSNIMDLRKNDTVVEMRFGLGKYVPESVKNVFKSDKNKTNESPKNSKNDDETKKMEHGSLDFFGRDLVRGVGKTINTVQEKIGWKSSNQSEGLDSNKTFFSGVKEKFQEAVQAIYPGTKWCGDGNKSRGYHDLGLLSDTDSCCREHDLCQDNIPAGGNKYGLLNTGLFTRSHCDCDRKFYDCLKEVDSLTSKNIGFTYFSVLGPQCFRQHYPIKGCARKESGKCVTYQYEERGEKVYQWFDSPKF